MVKKIKILNVKHEMDEIKKENILIKEKMKYLEEKLNNITRNNNIQYSKKDYYNGNIMENTIENYFDSKENSNNKEKECKKEIEKINNEQVNLFHFLLENYLKKHKEQQILRA